MGHRKFTSSQKVRAAEHILVHRCRHEARIRHSIGSVIQGKQTLDIGGSRRRAREVETLLGQKHGSQVQMESFGGSKFSGVMEH